MAAPSGEEKVHNSVKQAAATGERIRGVHLTFAAPTVIEVLASLPVDFVYIDGEHGAFGIRDVEACCIAAERHAITAIADRYPRWGIDFLYGVVAVALGVYIVASWPISSFWVLGTVVGIEIIARGVALVSASWALRSIEHGELPSGMVAA